VAKAKLEHGVGWTTVESPGTYASHDALLTRVAGLPLWLTVADCLPVAFSAGAWVGLAHCGWRGTAGGLAAIVAVEIGARAATGIADVRAWIGAGIGECCYEVGPDVAARFPAETIHAAGDSMRLNLSRAVQISLMEAGVPAASIHASELCTACRADLFFSYRRDGPRSGRMAAVVWKPAP
jgi:YfiH family protein